MQQSHTTFSPLGTQARRRRKLPLALWAVVIGMGGAFLVDSILGSFYKIPAFFGFSVSSVGWLVPLLICGYMLLRSGMQRSRFPLLMWLPWSLWVLAYLIQAEQPNALQRSIMLLTPVVLGIAVSNVHADALVLDKASQWLDRFFWAFMIAVGLTTGLLKSGELAEATGFAAGSITASLLAVWYAGRYVTFTNRRDLYRWVLLAAVPVLANTRTGMVAVAITLPLTFVPWPIAKRLLVICVLVIAGLLVFQMDRIQSKMFYARQGTLQDAINGAIGLLTGNELIAGDFATSGRLAMTLALKQGIEGHYWFGLGANASEPISMAIADVSHPHNDWLRLQHDYGTLGMSLFALTLMGMALHAFLLARRLPRETALFLYVGAGAFVPMSIFMFTDNVILYAAWFGNLHFALLGLGYAAAGDLSRTSQRGGSYWR